MGEGMVKRRGICELEGKTGLIYVSRLPRPMRDTERKDHLCSVAVCSAASFLHNAASAITNLGRLTHEMFITRQVHGSHWRAGLSSGLLDNSSST